MRENVVKALRSLITGIQMRSRHVVVADGTFLFCLLLLFFAVRVPLEVAKSFSDTAF